MSQVVDIDNGSDFILQSAAERSSRMGKALTNFADRMSSSNNRTLSQVISIIQGLEPTENEQLRLNIFSSHLQKESPEFQSVQTWPPYKIESFAQIKRLKDVMPMLGWGNDPGMGTYASVRPKSCPRETRNMVRRFLSELTTAIRARASKNLLGDDIETIELPPEYCEFARQTSGVSSSNWDRIEFMTSFGYIFPDAESKAEALGDIRRKTCPTGFDVAAGWCAGDEEGYCSIYYLLCRPATSSAQWKWRIFINGLNESRSIFDSFWKFLDWYSDPHGRVPWDDVQKSVEACHEQLMNSSKEKA